MTEQVVVAAIAVHRAQQQCSVCSAVIRFQVHSPSFPFLSFPFFCSSFHCHRHYTAAGLCLQMSPRQRERETEMMMGRPPLLTSKERSQRGAGSKEKGGSPTKFRLIWPSSSSMDHTHTQPNLHFCFLFFLVFGTCLGSEWESLSIGDDGDGTRWQDHRSTI